MDKEPFYLLVIVFVIINKKHAILLSPLGHIFFHPNPSNSLNRSLLLKWPAWSHHSHLITITASSATTLIKDDVFRMLFHHMWGSMLFTIKNLLTRIYVYMNKKKIWKKSCKKLTVVERTQEQVVFALFVSEREFIAYGATTLYVHSVVLGCGGMLQEYPRGHETERQNQCFAGGELRPSEELVIFSWHL